MGDRPTLTCSAGPAATPQAARQQRVAIEGLLNDGTSSFVKALGFPSFEPHSSRSHSPSQGSNSRDEQARTFGADGSLNAVAPLDDLFAVPSFDPYTEFMVFDFSDDYGDLGAHLLPSPEFPVPTIGGAQDEADQRVRRAIDDKIHQLGLDDCDDLCSAHELLLSGNNVAAHVARYFTRWQHSCPIIHEASFVRSSVPLTLLLAMSLLGAMYSKDRAKKLAARRLLDVAELVVFDVDMFSVEADIQRQIRSENPHIAVDRERHYTWEEFQELQAAYLMVEAQYWAGSRAAKRRVVDTRLGSVVSVC
jgi:hypothetical protein